MGAPAVRKVLDEALSQSEADFREGYGADCLREDMNDLFEISADLADAKEGDVTVAVNVMQAIRYLMNLVRFAASEGKLDMSCM